MSRPLEEYGIVGDMRTLAAIGSDGAVDWLCWPRFDSPSIFGALLDDDGGRWLIEPLADSDGHSQVYLSGTNVLITRFHAEDGLVEIEDFMVVGDEDHHGEHDRQHLVRAVKCCRGTVAMRSTLTPRPDYGRADAAIERNADGSCSVTSTGGLDVVVSATTELVVDGDAITSEFTLEEGEAVYFSLGDRRVAPEAFHPLAERTEWFWRDWAGRITYTGRWREWVERSALVLKMLTHQPSGGILAAGTMSVPEVPGGERNWDYRYVWIRDAAFTVYALIKIGHLQEANAFTEWLAARVEDCEEGDVPPLSPLYDLDGNADIEEYELDHWAGYADSRPVRVGNAASGQLQLDIYGELIDALYLSDKHGDAVSIDTWRRICLIIDWLSSHWEEPDNGIWEARRGPQRYTSSLLMSWVAVERAIRMATSRGRPAPLDEWRRVRDEMHDVLVERGFNEDLGTFTQVLDGDTVDAAILLAPLVKFISPTDPRWTSTLEAIGEKLAHGPLVDRYDLADTDDGLEGDEGSFTICSFWYVEALARSGRLHDAQSLLDRLLSYASPAGIFSEEIGRNGRLLGNLPQAFTHLALISAVTYLDEALGDD